jgi:hypothetical protein
LIIQTAKLNGANPMTWLTHVLERAVAGSTKSHELHIPLPRNWTVFRSIATTQAA